LPAVANAETMAVQTALGSLAELQREAPLRVHVAAGWQPLVLSPSKDELDRGARATAAFWIIAEFSAAAPPDRDVDVTVSSASGATVGRITSRGGSRNALVQVRPMEPPASGEYTVRVRTEGFGVGTVRVSLPPSPDPGGAVLVRRGPVTGNRDLPTADLRFRRNERLRVDIPTPDTGAVAARLLDR